MEKRIEKGITHVSIDDDCFITCLAKSPDRMNGTIVEFNTLTNSDRAGTDNDNLLLIRRYSFRVLIVG